MNKLFHVRIGYLRIPLECFRGPMIPEIITIHNKSQWSTKCKNHMANNKQNFLLMTANNHNITFPTTTTTLQATKTYYHIRCGSSMLETTLKPFYTSAIFQPRLITNHRACYPRRFVYTESSTTSGTSILQKQEKNGKAGTMSDEVAKAQTATDDGQVTIFGKILKGEIPCKFIYEDDLVVAFDDINPVAPVHFLVIPRKPISMLSKSSDDDELILGRMMCVARKVAEQKCLAENGYRLVINNGRHGCQSVYHIHLHVIGGRQLGWPPC